MMYRWCIHDPYMMNHFVLRNYADWYASVHGSSASKSFFEGYTVLSTCRQHGMNGACE